MEVVVVFPSVVVGLPIADRVVSHRFYQDTLGLTAVGEPAGDGVPEPLQFVVNDGLRVMLVPAGGFGWVIGDNEVCPRGRSECVITLTVADRAEVTRLVDRARDAGGEVTAAPADRPWGFTGMFADPDGHLWQVVAAG